MDFLMVYLVKEVEVFYQPIKEHFNLLVCFKNEKSPY